MPPDEEPLHRFRRLCEERRIIAAARARTRYFQTDLIDDAGVLRRASVELAARARAEAQRGEARLLDEDDDAVARVLATEVALVLRDCLVTALTGTYDLVGVVADACARAGVSDRERQLAYCLVVLCQKHDPLRAPFRGGPPVRTYGLDIGKLGFAERLRTWADAVAANLRDWAATYAAIHEEARVYDITTLRGLIPLARDEDDIATRLADELAAVLTEGRPLEEMSLATARAEEPSGSEYVFQTPLPRWVHTSARRRIPRATDPLDDHDQPAPSLKPDEDLAQREREEVYRGLIASVARLDATRGLLEKALGEADRQERLAEAIRFASDEDADLFRRFRAELAAVANRLRDEQRSFGAMLAYLLLAMRVADKRQRVAILSLRNDELERHVIEHVARRMRALLAGGEPPTPALILKTAGASRELVPASRVRELERLRDDRGHRTAALGSLAGLLDELPATVGDLASIAAAMPGGMTPGSVGTTRGQAADELTAVDTLFGRTFRRYAMRCP